MTIYDPYNGEQARCLACGVSQDKKNGIARGACAHCRIGHLAGFYVGPGRTTCRYKGCSGKAVAEDGKWPVCKSHLAKRRPDLVCAEA